MSKTEFTGRGNNSRAHNILPLGNHIRKIARGTSQSPSSPGHPLDYYTNSGNTMRNGYPSHQTSNGYSNHQASNSSLVEYSNSYSYVQEQTQGRGARTNQIIPDHYALGQHSSDQLIIDTEGFDTQHRSMGNTNTARLTGSNDSLYSPLKVPPRYAGELQSLVHIYQRYESQHRDLIGRMMMKNQYQKSFGETSKPHANNLSLANDYYIAGKGANGVTYGKKEVYTSYVRVIQGLINLPSTKELKHCASAPKQFAQEYQGYLRNGDIEVLTKFYNDFMMLVKQLLDDIKKENPGLSKLLDEVQGQVKDALTDQIKSSTGLDVVGKIKDALLSPLGKGITALTVMAVATVGAGFAGAAIQKSLGNNSSNSGGDTDNSDLLEQIRVLKATVATQTQTITDQGTTITTLQTDIAAQKPTALSVTNLIYQFSEAAGTMIAKINNNPSSCPSDAGNKYNTMHAFNGLYQNCIDNLPTTASTTDVLGCVTATSTGIPKLIIAMNACVA